MCDIALIAAPMTRLAGVQLDVTIILSSDGSNTALDAQTAPAKLEDLTEKSQDFLIEEACARAARLRG